MNEVLNILSESYCNKKIGGPNKVIVNTLKGLDKIGYPYVLNKNIRNYKYNWIHDSQKALIEVAVRKIPAVVGPNLFVLPGELPALMPSIKHCVYLFPSQWCIDLWTYLGYNNSQMLSWPAGINTEQFSLNRKRVDPKQVLVYFKRRDPAILEEVKKTLRDNGFEPKVIIYGKYKENEFIEALATSLFGVWITISESQGIALQEALATGCPLLVLNVKTLFEATEGVNYKFPDSLKDFKPTSVPYFDTRCGIIIDDLSLVDEKIKEMASGIMHFNPREFVLENLSLESMAQMLLGFFDRLDLTKYTGRTAKMKKDFSISFKAKLIFWSMVLNRKIHTALGKRWVEN